MLGQDALLFPDTGSQFLATAKTAALYSNQVYALTILHPAAPAIFATVPALFGNRIKGPMAEYASFLNESRSELHLLAQENVLIPLPAAMSGFKAGDTPESLTVAIGELSATLSTKHERIKALAKSLLARTIGLPVGLSDVLSWALANADTLALLLPNFQEQFNKLRELPDEPDDEDLMDLVRDGQMEKIFELSEKLKDVSDEELIGMLRVGQLFLCAQLSETIGAGICTWDRAFQESLWMCRSLSDEIDDSTPMSELVYRRSITSELGRRVVERYLPCVHDLPASEVLRLRERRASELESFRVALGQLATEIDPTSPPSELAIEDAIASRVDPAVYDLKRSLKAAIVNAMSGNDIAIASIPVAISVAGGFPLKAGLLAGVAKLFVSGAINVARERSRLKAASQWSVLLDFQKIQRGKD